MVVKVAVAYDILRLDEKAIITALKSAGAEVQPIHLEVTAVELGSDSSGINADAVLQRSTSHYLALEFTVALEGLVLRVINSSRTIAVAIDKVRSTSQPRAHEKPTPATAIAFSPDAVFSATEEIGYPVVIKPVSGSWGRIVCLARDGEEIRAIAEHRRYLPGINSRVFIVQEYVGKPGRDLRVFVVGGEVLGVDVFEDFEREYLINEVNVMTEFRNTVRITGCNLHVKIAEYAIGAAKR